MQEWNATTMTMAKPRRLLRAKLDLVMLRTAIAFPHTGKVGRDIAPRREQARVRRHSLVAAIMLQFALRTTIACRAWAGKRHFNPNKAKRIAAFTLNSQG